VRKKQTHAFSISKRERERTLLYVRVYLQNIYCALVLLNVHILQQRAGADGEAEQAGDARQQHGNDASDGSQSTIRRGRERDRGGSLGFVRRMLNIHRRGPATAQWEKIITLGAAGLTFGVTLWKRVCAFDVGWVQAVVTLGVVTRELRRVARLTAGVGQMYLDARSIHPLRGDLVAALLLQPRAGVILRNHLIDAVLIVRHYVQHFLVVQLHAVVVDVGAQRVVHANAFVFAAEILTAIPPALAVRTLDVSAPFGIGLTVTQLTDLLPIAGALAVVTVVIVEVLETTFLVPIVALAGKVPPVSRRPVPVVVVARDRVNLSLHQDTADSHHR